ncbi:unnamed protein product [Prorocentrum cordatum]|uniref:Uncharacterized protein n=1 Tax=Prorocentrum cordatum TaxID=2364126 RepID=A0ABN9S8D5_9DINO|nr:unnamed protein product [Polarella glacialis]
MNQEIPNRCLEGEELYGHFLETGNWFTKPMPDHRPTATNRAPFIDQGLQILRRPEVQALPALRNWGQNRLCFGWVDILYIPYHVWPDWRQLTLYFGGLFHEVAAYTMLNMLVRSGRAPGVETIDFCEGNCCHTQAPKAILTSPCGHTMNLRMGDVRDIFEGVLRTYNATQKVNRSGSASRLPRLGQPWLHGGMRVLPEPLHGGFVGVSCRRRPGTENGEGRGGSRNGRVSTGGCWRGALALALSHRALPFSGFLLRRLPSLCTESMATLFRRPRGVASA